MLWNDINCTKRLGVEKINQLMAALSFEFWYEGQKILCKEDTKNKN